MMSDHSLFDTERFFQHLAQRSARHASDADTFAQCIQSLDSASWHLLRGLALSGKPVSENVVGFFNRLFPALPVEAQVVVFAQIVRPLVRQAPSLDPFDPKPIAAVLTFVFKQRFLDYSMLYFFLAKLVARFERKEMQSMAALEALFPLIDALPSGSEVPKILMALNNADGKVIKDAILGSHERCLRLESHDAFLAEKSAYLRACDETYDALARGGRDGRAHLATSTKLSQHQANMYFQSKAQQLLVELLFTHLYSDIKPMGGEAVLRSLLLRSTAHTHSFWLEVLFVLSPKIAIDLRNELAAAFVSILHAFPLTKQQISAARPPKVKSDRPRGRPIGSKSKVHREPPSSSVHSQPAPAESPVAQPKRLRPQRQSAYNVQLLTNHLYAEAPSVASMHSAHTQNGIKPIPTGPFGDSHEQSVTLPANHDAFTPLVEVLQSSALLLGFLQVHASIYTAENNDKAKESLRAFCLTHGIAMP